MSEIAEFLFLDDVKVQGYGESDSSGAWIKLQILPEQLDVFRGRKGEILEAALRIRDNDGTTHGGDKPVKVKQEPHEYGDYAKALRLSGFVAELDVLAALGTDSDYLAWLKLQPCALPMGIGDGHGGDVVAAHVRRIANGAGTGIKPQFSAIPLCDKHHQMQHAHGESTFPGGKAWFDELRVKYVTEWGWQRLKASLGIAHMYEASPAMLCDWAQAHGVYLHLPALIRHGVERAA